MTSKEVLEGLKGWAEGQAPDSMWAPRVGRRGSEDEELEGSEALLHEDAIAALAEVSRRPGNGRCADCAGGEPTPWAVVNWGVFVCLRCCSVHRQLGTHVSRVRSTTLDTWTLDEVEFMRVMGNERANSIWEQAVPQGWVKPVAGADMSERAAWIEAKYVREAFFGITTHEEAPAHMPVAFDAHAHSTYDARLGAAPPLCAGCAPIVADAPGARALAGGLPLRALSMASSLRRGTWRDSTSSVHRFVSSGSAISHAGDAPSISTALGAAGGAGDGAQQPIAVLLILGRICEYPLQLEREFSARLRRRVGKLVAAARGREHRPWPRIRRGAAHMHVHVARDIPAKRTIGLLRAN